MIDLEVISIMPESDPRPTPLLFVHGMWHAAWCWDEYFLPYFAGLGYEVHAVSLRGHGGSSSDRSLRWCRIRHYVEDLARVASDLRASPVLIGHSMGATVVQRYISSSAVPAAVLLAPVPRTGVGLITLRFLLRHPLVFLWCNLTMSMEGVISTAARERQMLFSDDTAEEDVLRYQNLLQDESYLAYLDLLFLDLPKPEKVDTPLLVLGAENDFVIRKSQVIKTARACGAESDILPGLAHGMILDSRWRTVAERISTWLTGLGI